MLTLALIGLVGGLITGVSPCVLPMLPIIFIAGGDKTGAEPVKRRPLKIILGVVVSFSIIALAGSAILSALGLPDDFLRWTGLVVLGIVGLGLLIPPLGHLIEKPFYRLPKFTKNDGGPFLLGLGLGTLYVPCAGPVLAAITVAGATGQVGWSTVLLTVAFAIGAALPLLVFAAAGSRMAERIKAYRRRDRIFRSVSGAILIALAVALAFNVTDAIQRKVPAYTSGLEKKVAESETFQGALTPPSSDLNKELAKCTPGDDKLADCGAAPPLRGISRWYNTPGDKPVSLGSLKGKVVLIDFWAYSCINCQRNQPYLNAWYDTYKDSGLEIIGVQSPEFSFERNEKNVARAIEKEGIEYPAALDPELKTWTDYRNQYWPAKYLVDAAGNVRAIKFGEGDYDQTETLIREALQVANPGEKLPAPTSDKVRADDVGGEGTTPETYLGWSKTENYSGARRLATDNTASYAFGGTQAPDTWSLDGTWTVDADYITPKDGSRLRIDVNARRVYHVISGTGRVTVEVDGEPTRIIDVEGEPNAYEIYTGERQEHKVVTLRYNGDLKLFTFSFG